MMTFLKTILSPKFVEGKQWVKDLVNVFAAFVYFDKALIFFICNKWWNIYCFFSTVIVALIGIANFSFGFAFSMTTGMIKKLLETTPNKKGKQNKIVMLSRSK